MLTDQGGSCARSFRQPLPGHGIAQPQPGDGIELGHRTDHHQVGRQVAGEQAHRGRVFAELDKGFVHHEKGLRVGRCQRPQPLAVEQGSRGVVRVAEKDQIAGPKPAGKLLPVRLETLLREQVKESHRTPGATGRGFIVDITGTGDKRPDARPGPVTGQKATHWHRCRDDGLRREPVRIGERGCQLDGPPGRDNGQARPVAGESPGAGSLAGQSGLMLALKSRISAGRLPLCAARAAAIAAVAAGVGICPQPLRVAPSAIASVPFIISTRTYLAMALRPRGFFRIFGRVCLPSPQ